MTLFWIIATLLVLACMALLVVPLVSENKAQLQDVSDKASNVVYFREQAGELQNQVNSGIISEQEAMALREELERKLLADVTDNDEEVQFSFHRTGVQQGLLAALLIPALAFPLYYKLGATTEMAITATLMSSESTHQDVLLALEEWVEKRPDNVQAMFMLGGQYRGEGRLNESVQTFRRLYEITGGHFQVAEELAQVLYLSEGRKITAEIRRLVNRVLAVDEMNATALSLQGVDAFHQEEYREAIRIWMLALNVETNPRSREELTTGIKEARQLLGEPTPEIRVQVNSDSVIELQIMPSS